MLQGWAAIRQCLSLSHLFRQIQVTMVWQSLQSHLRATAPHLRPIRGIMVAFAITGYLLYRLPVSGESWAVGHVNML